MTRSSVFLLSRKFAIRFAGKGPVPDLLTPIRVDEPAGGEFIGVGSKVCGDCMRPNPGRALKTDLYAIHMLIIRVKVHSYFFNVNVLQVGPHGACLRSALLRTARKALRLLPNLPDH